MSLKTMLEKKVSEAAALKQKTQDDYGFFGPSYSFGDNIPLPGEIGVRKESSFSAIFDAVGGINYYLDTIAFGGPTFFDKQDLRPMGIRYFLNTGMRCSNGASMSEYFDGVTKGDLLGQRVADGLASAGLPGLKGLAPGMLENARDALDPRPILSAVTSTGYPICQQVACSVGDSYGRVANLADGKQYLADPADYNYGYPSQTRWVQALDEKGNARTMTKGEFAAAPKCYNPDGTYMTDPPEGCPRTEPPESYLPIANRKYSQCHLVRAATPAPPPVENEGFDTVGISHRSEKIAIGAAIAIIAGVAVWSVLRK